MPRDYFSPWLQVIYMTLCMAILVVHPFICLVWTVARVFVYRVLHGCKHCLSACVSLPLDQTIIIWRQYQSACREQAILQDHQKLEERARKRSLRLALPPTEEILKNCRLRELKAQKTKSFITSTFKHLVLLSLLVIASTNIYVQEKHQADNSIRNSITNGSCWVEADENYVKFPDINSREGWWNWTFSELMAMTYNEDKFYTDKHLFCDTNAVIVGMPRIREYTVKSRDCDVSNYMISGNLSFLSVLDIFYCFPGYKDLVHHVSNFHGEDHKKYEWDAHYLAVLRGVHSQYSFTSTEHTLPEGEFNALLYLVTLQATHYLMYKKLTRGILTEFTLYHPQHLLFTSVSLIAEFPEVSGAQPIVFVQSTYLDRYRSSWSSVAMAAEILLLPIAMSFTVNVLLQLYSCRFTFWKSVWNTLDLVFACLLWGYLVCIMLRVHIAEDLLWQLKVSYYDKYVNLKSVVTWDYIIECILGLLIFFQVMRSLRLLDYFYFFRRLGIIVAKSISEIVAILIWFIFPMAAACIFTGFLLFNVLTEFYNSAYHASLSVFSLLTKTNAKVFNSNDFPSGLRLLANIHVAFIIICIFSLLRAFSFSVFSYVFKYENPNRRPVEINLSDVWKHVTLNVRTMLCFKQKSRCKDAEITVQKTLERPMHFSEIQSRFAELENNLDLIYHKLGHVADSFDLDSEDGQDLDDSQAFNDSFSMCAESVSSLENTSVVRRRHTGSYAPSISVDGFTDVPSFSAEKKVAHNLVSGLHLASGSPSISANFTPAQVVVDKNKDHMVKFLKDVQNCNSASAHSFSKYGKHLTKIKMRTSASSKFKTNSPLWAVDSCITVTDRLRKTQSFGLEDESDVPWDLYSINSEDSDLQHPH